MSQPLPVDIWRVIWERDLRDDGVIIGRWSLTCEMHHQTFLLSCRRLRMRAVHGDPEELFGICDEAGLVDFTDIGIPNSPRRAAFKVWAIMRGLWDRVTDNTVIALPPGLTHLDLKWNKHLTEACIPHLPRTLAYLDLRRLRCVSTAYMAHLPRTLTHLNLRNAALTDSDMPHLPPALTHLVLRYAVWLTAASLPYLPRTLTHLEISTNGESFLSSDDNIALLPRSLVDLYLWQSGMNACYLTEACVKNFPRSLTSLRIDGGGSRRENMWTDACVPHLPPKLKHLRLPYNSNLTESCLARMPPGLETLEWPLHLHRAWKRRQRQKC